MGSWNIRGKYDTSDATKRKKRLSPKEFRNILKRQMYLSALSLVGVSLIMVGTTYSILSSVNKSKDYNVVTAGTLQITYDDTSSGLGNIIKLTNTFPITDATGISSTPYKFKLTNTGSLASDYSVRIVDDTAMIAKDGCQSLQLNKGYIKYSVNGATGKLLNSVEGNGYIVASGTLQPGASQIYEIRMWIPEQINGAYVGNEVLGKHFHGKVVIEGLKG